MEEERNRFRYPEMALAALLLSINQRMPDNENPLHTFIECTRRCCSFLSGVVCSLVSRHCTDLVSPFRASNNLPLERDSCLTVMAAREPIEITSSDSESWDLEEYRNLDASPLRDSGASASAGPLFSEVSRNQRDPHSQEFSALKRTFDSNGSSSKADHHTEEVGRILPTTLQPTSRNPRLSKPSENASNRQTHHHGTLNPFQHGTYSVSLSNSSENASSSRNHDRGKSPFYPRTDISNSGNHTRDHLGRLRDDELSIIENAKKLPQWDLPGKSMAPSQYMGSIDQMARPAYGEERTVGSDERLIYQAALQDLNQPKVEATLPDGLLSVSLLRHQKIALAWMLQKETSSLHCLGGILADDQGLGKTISTIALVQMQRHLQSKSKSESQPSCKTEALNLDDDDDDNGSESLNKSKQAVESDDSKLKPGVSTSVQEFSKRRPAAGTLVVCPASVLRQWAREMDDKVADEAKLSVLIYHGGNRTKDPVELAKYDVVLTTYAIVTNEVPKQPLVDEDDDDQKNGEQYGVSSEFLMNKKRKKMATDSKKGKKRKKGVDSSTFDSDCGTLARVGWFRVVLDEAQTIKNHRTQVARACCGLRAKRRWCLSGTPIQNAIDELYSYFRFLKYDPYAAYKSFCSTIKYPIARNSLHGYKKLQAVLRAIMLRRTKGTLLDGEPIICLPPKTIELAKVDFSTEERAFYTKLETDSRLKFKAYAAAGTVRQNYANILLMLLRLRQACDHPLLVKEFSMVSSDPVGKDSLEMAKKLPKDLLVNLLSLLEASSAICRLCSDPPEDAVVTMCGHVFCYQCVSDYLTGDENTCPVPECREQLGTDVVYSKTTLESCISRGSDSNSSSSPEFPDNSIFMTNKYSSSKIRAALKILESHCKPKSRTQEFYDLEHQNGSSSYSESSSRVRAAKDADTGPFKAIVFSQWTSMLDLVESALTQTSLRYRRLDGTMSLASRDRAVKEFNTDPEVTVMLMSLKAGNLGLNMVAASHVILLDLWWNPATEDQAIDRAHRIGQTRPVTVSRITVKDTVEDRILALQEEKKKMVASAFGEDQSGGSTKGLTVEDLKYLFMV